MTPTPKFCLRNSILFAAACLAGILTTGCDGPPADSDSDSTAQSEVSVKRAALNADNVCVDGDPACTPSGAHAKHGTFACTVCHKVAGRLAFDRLGPAYKAGYPAPTFNAGTKVCANVACHGVPPGTFTYYFQGGDGEAELRTASYGSAAPHDTASWYATGAAACTSCHDNPPRNSVWHSGLHATITNPGAGTTNQCQFCHSDASSPGNGIGATITNPSLHANGVVDVTATFRNSCMNCH